jgi:hypothetical protein
MRFYHALPVLLGSIVGCQESKPPEVVVNWGEVDTTLPPAQQELQVTMRDFLRAVQSGADYNRLYTMLPNTVIKEPESSFFGEGVHLVRWDWMGPPHGNVIPVRLEMMLDIAPGDKTVEYERSYKINKASGKWIIARQSP